MQQLENLSARGAANRDESLQHGERISAPCTPSSAQVPTGTAQASPSRGIMTVEDGPHDRPASDQLHPLVYVAAVGLVLLFAASAWAAFDDGTYTEIPLAVMSGFFLMAVAIACALWLTWRRHREIGAAKEESISLRDWGRGQLDTSAGRRRAAAAAVEVLLPLAAVAFGMTGFAVVFHFIAANAVHS